MKKVTQYDLVSKSLIGHRRRVFWERCAAEAMGAYIVDGQRDLPQVAKEAAIMAGRMLKEWDERFAKKT